MFYSDKENSLLNNKVFGKAKTQTHFVFLVSTNFQIESLHALVSNLQ